ncbi:Protein of unknown function [Leuconostoc citreum LBAE E16]|nr:Protein of unknown function [Leuconostoc citreum LBAE C11]CCF28835.1 Protein of unknown function [Leuconostoc citreum LBAE E16]
MRREDLGENEMKILYHLQGSVQLISVICSYQ